MAGMPQHPVILLALHADSGFVRSVTRGIADFFKPASPWHLVRLPPERLGRGAKIPTGCSGVITHVHHTRVLTPLRDSGCPVVCVSRLMEDDPFPHVGVDDAAVGQAAAEHLRSQGLKHFAFVGVSGFTFSRLRNLGFFTGLGFTAESPVGSKSISAAWLTQTPSPGMAKLKALDTWLADLPRPCGVFAANDAVAWFVSERCRSLGLRIPLDLALLGVDDDDVVCRLASPPLSSVLLPGERIGYLAAQGIEQAVSTGRAVKEIQLPPIRVVVRQSSEVYAVQDRDVAEALAYIRENATKGIGVEDVIAAVPLSRRSLERRFRIELQRSPLEEIHRVRIEAAKTLLTTTRLPIDQIGDRVGFVQPNYFARIFKRHAGLTPRSFRRLSS